VIIDIGGELAFKTAAFRAARGQQCFVIDPFGIASGVPAEMQRSFNPMRILDDPLSETRIEDAARIAAAIVTEEEGRFDPHWNESARQFLGALILHVATDSAYEGKRTLITVYKLLTGAGETLYREMDVNVAERGAIMEASAMLFAKPENERRNIMSTAQRHARFLGYPAMGRALSGASIDLKMLTAGPVTIYLCVPAARLDICTPWLRLFVAAVLGAIERERPVPPLPVVLCLNECAILGRPPILEIASQIPKGLRLWTLWSDIGQMKALYTDRWETFLATAGMVQLFGNSDLATLEWASQRLGETTIRWGSQPETRPAGGWKPGKKKDEPAEACHVVPSLMTGEEIARIFGREDRLLRQLVILAGHRPLIV